MALNAACTAKKIIIKRISSSVCVRLLSNYLNILRSRYIYLGWKLSIIIKSCFLSNWTKLREFLLKATKICKYIWFINVWISHKTHSVKSTKFQKLPWQKCLISLKKGKHKWWVHTWHIYIYNYV